jgi:hypothetical protein
MTLIVAFQTSDDRIVIAADGLKVEYNGESNTPSTINKLCEVRTTNWILAFAGTSAVEAFYLRLQAEIELGHRQFDPHLEIGGPAYLNALTRMASEGVEAAPGKQMPPTTAILAGFDIARKPLLLATMLPAGGYWPIRESVAIGIQDSTAFWLLRTLGDICTTLDRIKKLAAFIIWEASGQDLRVGKPELYPINLCVMEANKPHEYQQVERASVNG